MYCLGDSFLFFRSSRRTYISRLFRGIPWLAMPMASHSSAMACTGLSLHATADNAICYGKPWHDCHRKQWQLPPMLERHAMAVTMANNGSLTAIGKPRDMPRKPYSIPCQTPRQATATRSVPTSRLDPINKHPYGWGKGGWRASSGPFGGLIVLLHLVGDI